MIVYGDGVLSSAIFDNYDLSGLNIIGVADNKLLNLIMEFKGYKAIYPADILTMILMLYYWLLIIL
jgi:hypothetical protein